VYYHDPQYQRQRHHERISEMREDYRRAQRPQRHDDRPRERHMHMRSMWQWMRQHAMHRVHAHRA
jgi:hypothetical protein